MPDDLPPELDPARFTIHVASPRAFRQAFVREGVGGVPLVCVHGWPETKRIYWKVIAPLAAAGFEVIVPDLRGFGDSDVGPDGLHDVASHALDLYALVHDELGHDRVVLMGGDLGGPVVQDLALRHPEWVARMVLFNSPLAYDKERMAGMRTRPPREASDYFIRQATDADALAAELATPGERRRYIATFYTSRFWAHPGAFDGPAVDFHTEPFADGAKLRASFGGYESTVDAGREVRAAASRPQPGHADAHPVRTVRPRPVPRLRPDGGGGVRPSRRALPPPGLRPLRPVGVPRSARLRHGRALRRPPRRGVARAQVGGVALGGGAAHTQVVSFVAIEEVLLVCDTGTANEESPPG